MNVKITAIWDDMPRSFVDRYECFGGTRYRTATPNIYAKLFLEGSGISTRYYHVIGLEELRKTMLDFFQENRFPGQDRSHSFLSYKVASFRAEPAGWKIDTFLR